MRGLLKTIDFIMGYQTDYASKYGRESRATNQLMQSMATVASTHQIGLIVVDEIQYLNVAKSGGEEEFLNFLVRLVNIIGVPVVLVGTCEAERLFSRAFREARRGSGQGDLFWEPLKFEEDWTIYSSLCGNINTSPIRRHSQKNSVRRCMMFPSV